MTVPSKFELTVVVPIYNEEENIKQLDVELKEYLSATEIPSKVLFVNDGSTDNSQKLLDELCESNSAYHFIEFKKNRGLSSAIKAGIDYCDTNLIGYMDADIQTKPIDFITFFPFLEEYDLIIGIRAKRKDTFVKKMSSLIANSFRRIMINDGITDTGCPLKIIKIEYARKIPFFDGMHRFIPALAKLENARIKQLAVNHYPRYAGTAKYHLWNRIRKPLVDTFAYRWMKNRYISYEIKNKG